MKQSFALLILIGFLSASLHAQTAPSPVYNIRDYGAMGTGLANDTRAINSAIDAAAKRGGGTVWFPAGTYLSYSIHLRSNITLFLDQGCTLLAGDSAAGGRYDDPEPNAFDKYQDFGHSHWHNSLIWGEGLENISIMGPGLIWGKGLSRGFTVREGWERRGIRAGPYLIDGGGNKAIALKRCRNVILKDFTLIYGGHFGLLATGVDNLTIDNLKMDTNRDGMDIDCCQHVRISNCTVNTPYDDAICLKSSYALGENRPTRNVTITNCQVSGYDLGTFYKGTYERKEFNQVPDQEGPTGRIKFGTESNGGFQNITISNCVFEYCRGLALETVDGALLEDVTITNITMRDIVNAPLFLRLGGRLRAPEGTQPGVLRRVTISNLVSYNNDAHFSALISGLPGHDIEAISLSNIRVVYRPIDSPATRIQVQVPEHEKSYPEPQKFGVMPAYGFFIRHAKNVSLHNIDISFTGPETRTALILDDVKGADLFRIQAQKGAASPILKTTNCSGISIEKVSGTQDKQERW